MCTVTILPLKGHNSFVLTSNRDEATGRQTLPPKTYEVAGSKMAFPKDVLAGGTWLGVSDRKRAICLLNGAFKKHERKLPYGKSRGVVVKARLRETRARYVRYTVFFLIWMFSPEFKFDFFINFIGRFRQ